MLHIRSAAAALAQQEGNHLLCRATLHTAIALMAANSKEGDLAANSELSLNNHLSALKLMMRAGDSERIPLVRANVGVSYLHRMYRQGSATANVEQAIYHLEQALTELPEGGEGWVDAAGNLASAYQARKIGAPEQNLERAIGYLRAVLLRIDRTADAERWVDAQNNLGNALARSTRLESNLHEALEHYEAALSGTDRSRWPYQWADLHSNISLVLTRLPCNVVDEQQTRVIDHLQQAAEVYKDGALPLAHLETQRALGFRLMQSGRFEEAHNAFDQAIATDRLLFAESFTWSGRQEQIERAAPLYGRDSYCLVRCGLIAEAFARLEEGRARALNEALAVLTASQSAGAKQIKIDEFQQRVRRLEAEYRSLIRRSPGSETLKVGTELEEARKQLLKAVGSLSSDGMQYKPNVALALLATLPPSAMVVAPVVTECGTAVFVASGGTTCLDATHVVILDTFTLSILTDLLFDEKGWFGAYALRQQDPLLWSETIVSTCRTLSSALMEPVAERVRMQGLPNGGDIVLLCPGMLGVLPVHAAIHHTDAGDRMFCDEFSVSYAPSIGVLSSVKSRACESFGEGPSLLAVIDPTDDLPFALAEGALVSLRFKPNLRRVLTGGEGTSTRFFEEAGRATYLHLACHGTYGRSHPLDSLIRLADSDVSLDAILERLDLRRTRLAVLSACETARFALGHGADEQLGLTSGLLQAGALGVLSTLWDVGDLSAMLLIEQFYRLHLEERRRPAEALREAQRWLREVTAGELAKRFQDEEEAVLSGEAGIPIGTASAAYARFATLPIALSPFSAPIHWAAFTLTGA